MFDKNLRILIEQITELAVQRCGQEFEDYMQSLMAERERLLNNVWARTPAEGLDSPDTDRVLREIDFDMITIHAARYLKVSDYADFLYDVAELSLRFGQLEKAQSLLQLLIRKYAAAGERKLTASPTTCWAGLRSIKVNSNRPLKPMKPVWKSIWTWRTVRASAPCGMPWELC